ncbi:DNA helicase-2/ATP-dependent DNA helicase PcrA [Enterococcus sp. PF1-24]|uniref:RNA polymerase recycling motor HelD n=1 Tax=unclassified Enterococcus TaxID=2608891 RepID=UPI0024753AB6|nr:MULTISPECIES: RNA polymerase recycling motor HelD [unclassified Enterococcus]MDH6365184.1 DNA helicase-2/ATP-dependent DNA helicase PcrA [Enterococcus sp. PFB1-1]MDH6402285.1 DNA helicase-2/ATP-dependent DNA helicase PcrA [Enterococcus sp. PF1-24]
MDKEQQLEQLHVEETVTIIKQEDYVLKKQQQSAQQIMKEQSEQTADQQIRFGSDEAFYESAMDYYQHEQELLLRYQTLEAQEKRLKTLNIMEDNPYFARIDFSEDQENEKLYIGIASLRDRHENPIVIDWRAPISNLFYEGELGATSYESVDGMHDVQLTLKRQFKIRDAKIQAMADTSDTLTDDLLLDILAETSSNKMKNIVSTIQKAQNAIIRDKNKHLLVQGIAGSGKTSALLQRVAYVLYSNRKWLDSQEVLLFSPNHLFSDYISTVLPSLGESGIPTLTFQQFVHGLLPQYQIINEAQQEETFLSGEKNLSNRLKSGLQLVDFLEKYTKKITLFGPLFQDLKVDQQVVIEKSKIRYWYQETNIELPMYQRMQLLQTKLLKKIGGLQKDEARKTWVKDAVEEIIDDVVANDPDFEDNEKNEKRLRRKLAQQIVAQKFRPLSLRIKRYRFINYNKQYLHFLQSTPAKILQDNDITTEDWQENLLATRRAFGQKELLQEDAVLFFLLQKAMIPFTPKQKARFIFIDEMQDFSPAQVALLRKLYPRASFNFCGDLNQKVFANESIVQLLPHLFTNDEVKTYELTTSYRSTSQITEFANHLLSEDSLSETTARDGNLPIVIRAHSQQGALSYLQKQLLQINQQHPYWRTAIIAKSLADCQALYAQLSDEWQQKIQLVASEDDFLKRSVIIIPAYLAKGLEFDNVYLWDINFQNFTTSQDQLILYTMATRAMHELAVVTIQSASPLLSEIPESAYLLKEV